MKNVIEDFYIINGDRSQFRSDEFFGINEIDLSFLKITNKKNIATEYHAQVSINFDNDAINKLNQISQKFLCDSSWVFQIVFAIQIYRYTGQNQFFVGNYSIESSKTPDYEEIEVFLYRFSEDTKIIDILNQKNNISKLIKKDCYTHMDNSDLSINDSVINVLFSSTNKSDINLVGLNLKNKLLFIQNRCKGQINFKLLFNEQYYDKEIVIYFIDAYKQLFKSIINELFNVRDIYKLSLIKNYPILSTEQYNYIIDHLSSSKQIPINTQCVHVCFEKQVERVPNNQALIFGDRILTYLQLNEHSNQLAHYIRNNFEIKEGDLVALFIDRNEYTIITMLAVLKAGAAFVPIDPRYPDERISYILKDTAVKLILVNNNNYNRIKSLIDKLSKISLVSIDCKETNMKITNEPTTNVNSKTAYSNLMYVIYTSGTTGNPKGVMIEHKSFVAMIDSLKNIYFENKERISTYSITNYAFDMFGPEYGLTLLSGGCLTLATIDYDVLDCRNYDFIQMTPSHYELKLNDLVSISDVKLFVGAEQLSSPLLKRMLEKTKYVVHLYGPTETTVWSTSKLYSSGESIDLHIALGKPFSNERAYVLDSQLNPVPIGALGELHIDGIGVARGYLNKPELTRQKFLSNPFQSDAEKKLHQNSRMYKTGDLVRWLPTGELEYLGRNDFQVKIRGHRIELSEIENALLNYPGIRQSVVIARSRKTDVRYLVAYYVADSKQTEESILTYLSTKLPHYMIPNALVFLEKLPLNVNGKIDRALLPNPSSRENTSEYVKARTELEKQICVIWSDLFGISEEKISITDDFFRLGGDSIVSIQLVSRLRQQLGIQISVKDIFHYKSIEKLHDHVFNRVRKPTFNTIEKCKQKRVQSYLTESDVDFIINQDYLDKLQDSTEIDSVYLANSLQQGFIHHALNQGEIDDAYRVQIVFQYQNKITVKNLELAWRYAQQKFSSLRLRLAFEEEIIQVIDRTGELNWHYVDFSHLSLLEKTTAIEDLKKEDQKRSYDLNRGNLFRVHLIKEEETLYTCIFNNHHAILDGWSYPILLDYVHTTYLKLQANEKIIVVKDSSYEEAQQYLQAHQDIHKSYWEAYLSNIENRTDLSGLLSPKNKQIQITEYRHVKQPEEQEFIITGGLYKKLKTISSEEGVTLNAILQYIWHKILHIYGYSKQTVVGTTIAGRNIPINDIEKSVGLYINTLPLVVNHYQAENTVLDVIRKIQNDIIDINSKSEINLVKLIKEGEKLFDSLFVYENYSFSFNRKSYSDLNIKYIGETENLDYPISIIVSENRDNIRFRLKYAGELFSQEKIREFLVVVKLLIQQISANPYLKVKDLCYLTIEQHRDIIYKKSHLKRISYNKRTIQHLFEEQVEKTPNETALVFEGLKFTYSELNEKANQLAHYIMKITDIFPDTLIALCLDRSEYMLISILAVLKSGGAYVPIMPNFPLDRMQYILKDTATKLVIINQAYKKKFTKIKKLKDLAPALLEIDSKKVNENLLLESKRNPVTKSTENDLAYVLYTSGTTAAPKGVMMEHKGCVARIRQMIKDNDMSSKTSLLFKTNYTFDVSFSDIFCTWLSGGILNTTKSSFDVDEIKQKLMNGDIDICHFVPSQFNFIKDEINFNELFQLKKLMFSGELLDCNLFKDIKKNGLDVLNYYGPTESGEVTVNKFCTTNNLDEHNLIIGKPFDYVKTYVLDEHLNPVPMGAIGELYLSGIALARGYLNKPDLTKQKFISNPFQLGKGKDYNRLYKTGDLVRLLSDGKLEFRGRNDSQVKIRGIRIELCEIESILTAYKGIQKSIVIVQTRNNSEIKTDTEYLVAYYVAKEKLDEKNILKYLQDKLPEYMVPSVLYHLEEIPLTLNGKLDKNKLPKIDTVAKHYLAPKNNLENALCCIFAEILNTPENKISTDDTFYGLGGNSLLAIKLVIKINKTLNSNLNPAAIFSFNTVQKLADHLDKSSVTNQTFISEPVSVENQALSFAQERLWFIEKYNQGTFAYNMPMIFKIADNIKFDILEKSLISIVARHEVLRTVIKKNSNGHYYQYVKSEQELKVLKIKIKNKSMLDKYLNNEINYIYNLSEEIPIRASILDFYGKNENYKLLNILIHHIAFDGWSIDIFFKELKLLYNYNLDKSLGLITALNLPELPCQYKEFSRWQRIHLNRDLLSKQCEYWRSKLEDYQELNLAIDKVRPKQSNYVGNDIYFELDEKLSLILRQLAKRLNISLYNLLFSAYCLMLSVYSHQDDIIVGVPFSNRHYHQIENLIGFFVNTLVLRVKIENNQNIKDYILAVGQEIISTQLNQDLPFQKIVEILGINTEDNKHPLFQVLFTVQSFGGGLYCRSHQKTKTDLNDLLETYTEGVSLYNPAKFDISTAIDDSLVSLRGSFNYATELYNEKTIKQFIKTYRIILEYYADNVHKLDQLKVSNISYLSQKEYQKIVYNWNKTHKINANHELIHRAFEDQVIKTPENIALVSGEVRLTYCELNERANQLAHYLIKNEKINQSPFIGLFLKRNQNIVIAILAILKAGCAYVPIDPCYPNDRIQYTIEDANLSLIITDLISKTKLSTLINNTPSIANAINTLTLDSLEFKNALDLQLTNNLENKICASDLAYIIYTSGSTGKPKGVMIEHKSVTNLASAHIEMILSVTHKKMSHYLCYSNYVFDAHVWELFPCILNGQVAHIVSNELRHDLKLLNNYIKDNAVNIATIPPIMLSNTELLDVDILIVAGDKTPKEILDIYHSRNTIVINAYGPTETTVCSTFNHYSNNGPNNIGRPISNTKCYVLNSQLRPIPIGAIGELYISGINLAKGYLNKPDLSTERFLDNPYRTFREKQHHQYQKLYKTGDLVRWLPDGALEYLSRNDFQVKIRGHRVELNEIENVLSAHEKIQQVVVITKKRANKTDENDSGQYLAAYYTQKRKNENACTYVNQWKEIYESHYSNLDINNYRYNFDSWMSSYTGKAMLKEDMREWLDSTLENIKRLNPNVILEIGSGSGLILFNMIDDCNHYYATDISENVANYTRKIITKFGYTDKVSVFSGESNELPFHQIRNHYDTAVLNSVIQYFPNLDYLETVINKIIKNIHKNGKIFIGDVRDLRLLKCFHCSLLRFKNQNVTIKEIEYFSAKDKELLISPEYFMQLKAKNNLISHVEIIPKMGLANTEMNNYRYDVILHICGADNNRVDLNDADFTKVIDFEFCLGSLLKKDLSCIKYPNKKIISDYLRYKNIIGENVDSEITEKLELVELKEILKQLHLKNYNAKFYININDPLYLNIIIYDNNIHKDKIFNIKYQPNPPLLKQELANNPSLTAGNQSALSKNDLNAFLKEKLPSYMIPDHYIAIDKIPITSSGKLDKSALPDFDFIASDSYKAPSNPEEITMVKVWASVLELPEEVVGVEDNFFRLGGHSILALRLASLVGSELGKAISVSSIFEFSTIRKLINHLNHNDKPSLSEKWVF